jgi:hypothetical protein
LRYGRPRCRLAPPPTSRISQHLANERETRAAVRQEGSRSAHVIHGQRFVDGAGKFGIRTVHAPIMPLTHGTPLMLINVQFGP